MKRTPSMSLILQGPCYRRAQSNDAGPRHSVHTAVHQSAQGLPCSPEDVPDRDSCSQKECPWSYGTEPGVDVWRPPPFCQTRDGSDPDLFKRCSFCHRSLDRNDIFMYRGDKAFCSLECRHHRILMDERHHFFKVAGKRFSMVPHLGPAEVVSAPHPACWHASSSAPGPNVHTFV